MLEVQNYSSQTCRYSHACNMFYLTVTLHRSEFICFNSKGALILFNKTSNLKYILHQSIKTINISKKDTNYGVLPPFLYDIDI